MKKRRFYGIQKKLILYTLLASILPLSITGLILGSSINERVTKLNLENYTYSNTRMLSNYQLILKGFEELTEGYITNPYIQRSLEQQPLLPQEQAYVNRSLWFTNNQYAEYCFFLDNKENGYFLNQVIPGIRPQDILSEEMQRALEADYAKPLLLYSEIKIAGEAQKGLFLVRNIRHMERNVPPGVLIIKVEDQFFQDMFNGIQKHEDASYFMLSQNGETCFWQGDARIGEEEWKLIRQNLPEEGAAACTMFQDNQAYIISNDREWGFVLGSVVPMAVIREPAHLFLRSVLLIMATAICICVGISYVAARPYLVNIRKFSDVMSNFSARSLSQSIEMETNTELDQMAVAYNHMLSHIETLMEQVKAEQEEIRINEYNSLVYQINPHFLYNTLDNIHMLARMNGDQRMICLIQSLSRLLRISLSKGENEIPLRDELEHVQAYLEIEKIRSTDLFTYEICVDESLLSVKVPKIILQPIVENCIKFGFQDIYEGGRIYISVKKQGGWAKICIQNNGRSIDGETAKLLNGMQEKSLEEIKNIFPQKYGGYGISNVVCRLLLRYGENFRIHYEREMEGTSCVLWILE